MQIHKASTFLGSFLQTAISFSQNRHFVFNIYSFEFDLRWCIRRDNLVSHKHHQRKRRHVVCYSWRR